MKHKQQLLVIALLAMILQTMSGANLYWVGTNNSSWSNHANWSLTSGGIGGAGVPASSTTVIFDGNSIGNCTIDVTSNTTIAGLDIQWGYAGAITCSYTGTTPITFTISGTPATGVANFHGGSFTGYQSAPVSSGSGGSVEFSNATIKSNAPVEVANNFNLNTCMFWAASNFTQIGGILNMGSGILKCFPFYSSTIGFNAGTIVAGTGEARFITPATNNSTLTINGNSNFNEFTFQELSLWGCTSQTQTMLINANLIAADSVFIGRNPDIILNVNGTGSVSALGNFNMQGTKSQNGVGVVNLNIPVNVGGNVTIGAAPVAPANYANITGGGTGGLTLDGTANQVISQINSTWQFSNIEINNSTGAGVLASNITVNQLLTLHQGNLKTTNAALLTVGATGSVSGGSSSSYVDGPMKKIGNTAFTFPAGNAGVYQPLAISAPVLNTDAFTAQYFHAPPPTSGTTLDTTLASLSSCEYWNLQQTNGSSAVNVTLNWNQNSCTNTPSVMSVAYLNHSSKWGNLGSSAVYGDEVNGSVLSGIALSSAAGILTLGEKPNLGPQFIIPLQNKQQVLVNYTFDQNVNSYSAFPFNPAPSDPNVSCTLTSNIPFALAGGTDSPNGYVDNNNATDNALTATNPGGVNSPKNPQGYWMFQLSGTANELANFKTYGVYFSAGSSTHGPVSITVDYSSDGVNFTTATSYTFQDKGFFEDVIPNGISLGTLADNVENLYIRLTPSTQLTAAGVISIDNFQVVGTYSPAWLSVTVGGDHTNGLVSDGNLWSWGENYQGELGQGGVVSSASVLAPEAVASPNGKKFVKVATGFQHSAAIMADGSLWCWGCNAAGQLGDGTTAYYRTAPVQEKYKYTWIAVACGNSNTYAVRSDGTLWAWGYGLQGECGSTVTQNSNVPVQVDKVNTNYVSVYSSASSWFGFAIRSDQTLWGWGSNSSGNLGDGTSTNRSTPVNEFWGATWLSVATGAAHTVGIQTDGSLWTWGDNSESELGDGTTTSTAYPEQINAGSTYLAVGAGSGSSFAISAADNTLWSWGIDYAGSCPNCYQLGFSQLNFTPLNVPTQVGAGTWSAISSSNYSTIGIQSTDHAQYCSTGQNSNGQLGIGTGGMNGNFQDGFSCSNNSLNNFRIAPAPVAAITNAAPAASLAIYPNPANENIAIEYTIVDLKEASILITDMLGKRRAAFAGADLASGKITVNAKDLQLNPGIYIVTLQCDGKIQTKKIIIQE